MSAVGGSGGGVLHKTTVRLHPSRRPASSTVQAIVGVDSVVLEVKAIG